MSAARVAALEEAVRDLVTDCGDRGCECCRSSAALRARHRLLLSDSADRRTPEADPLDAPDQADAEALGVDEEEYRRIRWRTALPADPRPPEAQDESIVDALVAKRHAELKTRPMQRPTQARAYEDCLYCCASGRIGNGPCDHCDGTGHVLDEDTAGHIAALPGYDPATRSAQCPTNPMPVDREVLVERLSAVQKMRADYERAVDFWKTRALRAERQLDALDGEPNPCTDYPLPAQAAATDTAIRTLEYEAGARDQELADLRLRVVKLESAAGFVVRRAELATNESLRERIEALGRALDDAPCCLDCPHPVGFHDDQGRCTTPGCECPKLKDSRAEHPWLAPRTIAQVREELRRVHANNWHMTGHYEYARGYANGLHRAVSEIDNAIARNPLLAQQDELCRVARELIDAIAAPKGRDFRHAWEEACLRFGRFGEAPTLLATLRAEEREVCALLVEKQASIRRMRAQSIADDSDRADGEAQSDDIAREESAADLLEYVAARVRQRTETTRSR